MIKKKHGSIVVNLLIMALSAATFLSGLKLDEQGGFLPRIVSAIIFILSAWDLIVALLSKSEDTVSMEVKRVGIILAIIIGYVAVMYIVGYHVATFAFLSGFMYWLGVRKKAVLVLVPVVFLLMVQFFFVKFLYFRPIMPFFLR